MTLEIPSDLSSWPPNEVTEWLTQIEWEAEDKAYSDDEMVNARKAVSIALGVTTRVVWGASSDNKPPEGTPDGVMRVEKCIVCDEIRYVYPKDATDGIDPWRSHDAVCSPDYPMMNSWVGIEWTGDGKIRGMRSAKG